jgi:hypothetical protein
MQKLRWVSFGLFAIVASTAAASAQVCLGLPSFETRQAHLNVAAEFPEGAKAYAVGVGAGKHNNLFANLGAGRVSYDDDGGNSNYGFLEFGYQLPLGKLQLCPIAGGALYAGPDDDVNDIKQTARVATAGGALGLPLDAGTVRLIPNVGVKYEWVSLKIDEPLVGETKENSSGGVVDLGFAFVFKDRLSIQPLAHVFFGGDDNPDPSFGVFASVSFGWR